MNAPRNIWRHFGTTNSRDIVRRRADVAQLVEHVLGKDEVSGSIPDVGSERSEEDAPGLNGEGEKRVSVASQGRRRLAPRRGRAIRQQANMCDRENTFVFPWRKDSENRGFPRVRIPDVGSNRIGKQHVVS